jgi:hypothetical protein
VRSSLGLACLAADQGDWRRAATLHGVAQAFLDRTGEPWQDLEARYRNQSMADVRAHLGDEQFDRAYAQGTKLSVAEALQCARAPGAPFAKRRLRKILANPELLPPHDNKGDHRG